ncbi:MAG: chitinase [Cryptosporangiaceae bacterium]|nr:chitinase [Cryptosporangiaceae bacterium]
MRRTRTALMASALAVATGIGGFLAVTQTANAASGGLPAHVFAPYVEAWTGENIATLAQQSGDKYLTMAFLQTAAASEPCTAYWNGHTDQPIASSTFGSDIAAIRAKGGDVVPSFGGYTADSTGTEIADSCTNVDSIAQQFEKLITTYNITRIDLDVEVDSLTNSAGIDRRNKAIKKTEDLAAANGRTIQFVYTLPSTTHGLEASGIAVLQSALDNNARIDIVNMMTFDYYDNASHQMANDTKTAAAGLVAQLDELYKHTRTQAQLWAMVGITEMIGVDDFGPAETFTTADAPVVEKWAAQQGIAMLSFWALQRDNGNCPGGAASDSCSGVSQTQWQFSKAFQPFTSGTTSPAPSPSPSATKPPSPSPSPSGSPSPSPTGSPSAQAWAPNKPYTVGQVVTYGGKRYSCRQAHTSLVGWEPPNVPALWLAL